MSWILCFDVGVELILNLCHFRLKTNAASSHVCLHGLVTVNVISLDYFPQHKLINLRNNFGVSNFSHV